MAIEGAPQRRELRPIIEKLTVYFESDSVIKRRLST